MRRDTPFPEIVVLTRAQLDALPIGWPREVPAVGDCWRTSDTTRTLWFRTEWTGDGKCVIRQIEVRG